jgi:uncharacterized protein YbjT (DUF2867 family)
MRVLVLGGYGLIGLEIVRALGRAGYGVVGFGRHPNRGRRLAPDVGWTFGDLRVMQTPESWTSTLSDIEAVVNASGALQDGSRDNLKLAQEGAIRALIMECERRGVRRFVQISAPGAAPDAETAFLRTKGAADEALRASSLDWTILKPGLVISTGSYGGTTLLRTLVAMPFVQPLVLGEAKVQTVAGSDVGEAVRIVLVGEVPSRRVYDLVEDEPHTLAEVVKTMRRWVGRDDALWTWRLPRWFGFALARAGDLAGWLGWRSPLRTTALKALAKGVTGDPIPWREAGGFKLKPLEETLQAMPATMQERVFGRAQLVLPVLLLTLSAFWLTSGLIGALQREGAEALLAGRVDAEVALLLVGAGIGLDMVIGLGLLWRRWTRFWAWASIAVSIAYLAAGTWLTPELWADPLGPFVKVLPAIALALAVAALVEER